MDSLAKKTLNKHYIIYYCFSQFGKGNNLTLKDLKVVALCFPSLQKTYAAHIKHFIILVILLTQKERKRKEKEKHVLKMFTQWKPVSYTHLTLPTIYSV